MFKTCVTTYLFKGVTWQCFRGKRQVYTFLETLSIGDVNVVLWIKLKYMHGGACIYSVLYPKLHNM